MASVSAGHIILYWHLPKRSDGTQMKPDNPLYSWLDCQNNGILNTDPFPVYIDSLWACWVTGAALIFRLFFHLKKMNLMTLLVALKHQRFSHLDINFTFPVRGHSFLPADYVCRRIGQEIRQYTTIVLPEEYLRIPGNHGQVYEYTTELEQGGLATEISSLFKPTFYRAQFFFQPRPLPEGALHRLRRGQIHHVGKNVRIRAHRR